MCFFSSLKTNGILHLNVLLLNRVWYMKYRICTLWGNINFICSRFGNMTKSEPFVLYLFFVRRKYINVREHRMGNQKWTIQRKWQRRRKTKQKQNTICDEHHYAPARHEPSYNGFIILPSCYIYLLTP